MTAAEMSTAAGPPKLVGKSNAVEKPATCGMDSGDRMPDDKIQMPEMPETVWKPKINNIQYMNLDYSF
jgi:hypothetical protein